MPRLTAISTARTLIKKVFMTHGNKKPDEDGVIYSVGWSSALLTFDWGFVSDAIPVFYKSLNGYIKKLQK